VLEDLNQNAFTGSALFDAARSPSVGRGCASIYGGLSMLRRPIASDFPTTNCSFGFDEIYRHSIGAPSVAPSPHHSVLPDQAAMPS